MLQIRQEKPYYIADPEVDSLVSNIISLFSYNTNEWSPVATLMFYKTSQLYDPRESRETQYYLRFD